MCLIDLIEVEINNIRIWISGLYKMLAFEIQKGWQVEERGDWDWRKGEWMKMKVKGALVV